MNNTTDTPTIQFVVTGYPADSENNERVRKTFSRITEALDLYRVLLYSSEYTTGSVLELDDLGSGTQIVHFNGDFVSAPHLNGLGAR